MGIDVERVVEKLVSIGAGCVERKNARGRKYYMCYLESALTIVSPFVRGIEVRVDETAVDAWIPGEFWAENMRLEEPGEGGLSREDFKSKLSEKLGLRVELNTPAELNLWLEARDTESALRLVDAAERASKNELYMVVEKPEGKLVCKSGKKVIGCGKLIELLTGG